MPEPDENADAYQAAREEALSWLRANWEVPKHHGLSFFIIDLNQPGIQVRPLHQMNGDHGFNEVFFTDAHVDDDRLVGEAGNGWSVAVTVLMFERLMSGVPSVMPGSKGRNLDTPAGTAAERAARARATGRTSISDLILGTAAPTRSSGASWASGCSACPRSRGRTGMCRSRTSPLEPSGRAAEPPPPQ